MHSQLSSPQASLVAGLFSFACIAAFLGGPQEAEACSYAQTPRVKWTVPAEGAQVPPQAQIVLDIAKGDAQDFKFELFDEWDNDFPIDVVENDSLFIVTPSGFLQAAHYYLTISASVTEYGEEFTFYFDDLLFEVVEQPPHEAPEAPEIAQWSISELEPDSCHGSSYHHSQIQLDIGESNGDSWYEFHYTPGDFVFRNSADTQAFIHGFKAPHPNFSQDLCVTIRKVNLQGTSSDTIERCVPHECSRWNAETATYDDYDCSGDDVPADEGRRDDDEGAGCSTAPGELPALPLALLLLAAMLTGRSRTRRVIHHHFC